LKIPDRINLRHDEIAVLDRLNRPKFISQVLQELDLPEGQILRTLCGLLALGLLRRVGEEISGTITDEILISDTTRITGETQVSETAPPSSSETPSTTSGSFDVAAMAMFCYEVENMLVQVNRQGVDYYGVLGVSRHASAEEIKIAYNQYMEQFDVV